MATAASTTKLYRDCLRLARHLAGESPKGEKMRAMIRVQFRAGAAETDETKIGVLKFAAVRGLSNYMALEAGTKDPKVKVRGGAQATRFARESSPSFLLPLLRLNQLVARGTTVKSRQSAFACGVRCSWSSSIPLTPSPRVHEALNTIAQCLHSSACNFLSLSHKIWLFWLRGRPVAAAAAVTVKWSLWPGSLIAQAAMKAQTQRVGEQAIIEQEEADKIVSALHSRRSGSLRCLLHTRTRTHTRAHKHTVQNTRTHSPPTHARRHAHTQCRPVHEITHARTHRHTGRLCERTVLCVHRCFLQSAMHAFHGVCACLSGGTGVSCTCTSADLRARARIGLCACDCVRVSDQRARRG
jgi:hypothetical protein